ncbi:MAG TPA: hypothetical protein VNC78_02260 [Actinomycetota bacterium]|nr:hypothetical protein [Actinomycetota bacterium]
MNKKQLAAVFGAVAVAVIAIVILLVTGGEDGVKLPPEDAGDVTMIEGPKAPTDTALADIEFAEVRRDGNTITFEARLGTDIPKKLKGSTFDLRWDITGTTDVGQFILSGNLDVGPNVSLVGVENNLGTSTLDDTLQGTSQIEGNVWIITLQADDVDDFPDDFQWKLTTSIDGNPGDPTSGRAEDTAPDNGTAEVVEG